MLTKNQGREFKGAKQQKTKKSTKKQKNWKSTKTIILYIPKANQSTKLIEGA